MQAPVKVSGCGFVRERLPSSRGRTVPRPRPRPRGFLPGEPDSTGGWAGAGGGEGQAL